MANPRSAAGRSGLATPRIAMGAGVAVLAYDIDGHHEGSAVRSGIANPRIAAWRSGLAMPRTARVYDVVLPSSASVRGANGFDTGVAVLADARDGHSEGKAVRSGMANPEVQQGDPD